MSKFTKYTVILSILCIFGAGIFYYSAKATSEKEKFDPKAKPVKTLVVQTTNHNTIRSFPGKVRASKRVDLSFEIDGVLTELPVTEGMRVEKGQLLAKLDQRTYENNLLAAKAEFTEAKINLERQKKLLKEKIVAQSVLDTAQSKYDTAHAKFKIAEKNLEETTLHAPFDGIIATRFVENHTKINPSENIVSLQDVSNIEIVIQVPESIMVYSNDKIKNKELKVRFDVIPDREFDAKVHEFSLDADSQTQTYDVVLTMPTSNEFNFLPGMTASVTTDKFIHPAEKDLNHIWLPPTAIQGEEAGNKSFVFIIGKDNKAKKKYVELGLPTTSGIPVLSGLDDGDRVVIAGSGYIQDGMLLRAL